MGRLHLRWNSIHTKLLVSYLLLVALGTTVMAGYTLYSFHNYFLSARQTDLLNWTAALSESLADALERGDRDRVSVLVRRYGAPETVTLRVFDANGQLLATSDATDYQFATLLNLPGMRDALQSRESRGISKGMISNDDRLYVARPITRNGQLLGAMRMSITLKQFQRQFRNVIWTILLTLLFTIVLCALISNWLARSVSKPVERMRNFATRLGGGHFGDKLTIRQSNELDQLAIELNRMSERLASLDQERRAFLAKVSHELRTPISNVQVTVQALQSGACEEPSLRDRFFQTIEDETKRLSRLIHDLLDLGRLEAGVSHLERQPLSLSGLIQRALTVLEPRLKAAGVSTQINLVHLQVHADPERLLQALLNVFDNAIKHSPSGSTVRVAVARRGKWAEVTVQDQGSGIQARDLPHIFEQFYTTDVSRKSRSAGLGLAIAKRIIEAHGGTIAASSEPGSGATFTIALPL